MYDCMCFGIFNIHTIRIHIAAIITTTIQSFNRRNTCSNIYTYNTAIEFVIFIYGSNMYNMADKSKQTNTKLKWIIFLCNNILCVRTHTHAITHVIICEACSIELNRFIWESANVTAYVPIKYYMLHPVLSLVPNLEQFNANEQTKIV